MDENNKIQHKLVLEHGEILEIKSNRWKEYYKYCFNEFNSNPTSQRKIITSNITNLPVVDAMDAKDRGYQITISKEHGINRDKLSDMIEIFHITKETPFKLYFVVPQFILEEFKWNFDGKYKPNSKKKILKKKSMDELKKEFKISNFENKTKEQLIIEIMEEKKFDINITNEIDQIIKVYKIPLPNTDNIPFLDEL